MGLYMSFEQYSCTFSLERKLELFTPLIIQLPK